MEEAVKIISESVKKLMGEYGLEGFIPYTELILLLIFCSGIIPAIYKGVKYGFDELKKRKLFKDLHPFYDYHTIDVATKFYIATQCQNISPSKEHEPSESHAFATKEPLLPFFLKKAFNYKTDNQRYYLILADSGMGKTTFMINLYMRYSQKIFGKDYEIKLLPLGSPEIDDEINRIPQDVQQKTILLLDAFDEDPKASIIIDSETGSRKNNHLERFAHIMRLTRRFREVVITCRTQFFSNDEEEPKETGVAIFNTEGNGRLYVRKIYISPFDDKDIKNFLNKKYPLWRLYDLKKRQRAKMIIHKVPNLSVRPMLLSYIDELIDVDISKYSSLHTLYSALISKWIRREANRVESNRKENFIENLYIFSEKVALKIYFNLLNEKGLFISGEEILLLAEENSIQLSEIEMKGRSLLNRDSVGRYKFAHKSILEYFLACNMAKQHCVNISFLERGLDQGFKFNLEMLNIAQTHWKDFLTFKNEIGFALEKNRVDIPIKALNEQLKLNEDISVVEGGYLYDSKSNKPTKIKYDAKILSKPKQI